MLKKVTSESDFQTIQQLAKPIWQDLYVPIIGQAQVDYMLGKFYTAAALQSQKAEGQDFYLIEDESITIGYIGLTEKETGDYFLNKIYLSTQTQGKGIGKKAIQEVISLYPNMKNLRLQVNINNFKSINFYFKMGFTIENRFVLDIGESYIMDDFLMLKKI